jgi:RsiW-degrading membrane proteinase PrsW (M82 family)
MSYVIAIGAVLVYSTVIFFLIRNVAKGRLPDLILSVLFGVVSAVLALGLEFLWNYQLGSINRSHPSLIFIESFFGVSLIEESAKWMWLVFVISRWKKFVFYLDGTLYACGIAAGFNLVEEILYATIDPSPVSMMFRSFTAVPVHFFLGIVMGYLFAKYKFESPQFLWLSLLIPVIIHGVYDFFVLQQYAELLIGVAVLVILGSLALSVWIIRTAKKADRIRIVLSKQT